MGFVVWIESIHIAFREMRRHRTRTILTMLGVIFGVGAIITVVSISQGAKRTIQGQIANLGTNMIIILPGSTTQGGVRAGAGSASTLTLDDNEAIARECSAVACSAAVLRFVGQAVSQYANWGVQITAATADYLKVRSWAVEAGRPVEPRDVEAAAKVCLIGHSTAEQLFGTMDPIGEHIRVEGTPLTIIGLLGRKGQSPLGEDQDDTIVVPIKTAFQHLSGGDRPNAIVASAASEAQIPTAITQITALLRQRHQLRGQALDDFTVKSLEEAARTAEETSNVMTALLVSVAAVSLLVGGIGIMNIMLVTVMERTREIGIRMALGASPRMIMGQFVIESVTLAGVGGLLGVVVGLFGSKIITHFTQWDGIFSTTLLVAPVLFAIVVGLVFGLLPARRAARLNPVESLRHE
ncbi:MAG TPA: ABC transporter permease [Phycisphaerae bacterium]|nr:ABC transporter permease [Phycisphaerae bacterium]